MPFYEDGTPVKWPNPSGDLLWRSVTSPVSGSSEANTLLAVIQELTGKTLARGVEAKFDDVVPSDLKPEVTRLTSERLGKTTLNQGRSRPAYGETVEDVARRLFE